jgi:uncharacterized protein
MEEQTNQDIANKNSFWSAGGELRTIWKLLAFFAVFISSALALSFVSFFLPFSLANPLANSSILFLAVVIATSTTVIFIEQKSFVSVGLPVSGNWPRVLVSGVIISSTMMLLIAFIEYAAGVASFKTATVTFGLGFSIFTEGAALFLLVVFSEELLLRGYPMQTLAHRMKKSYAVLLIATLFTAIHIGNPNSTWLALLNIYLAGIWLGIAYFISESLWLPIGLHVGWNFTQSTLLGFPVSGLFERGILAASTHGPDWIGGGNFGPEGGALATVVLLAGTAMLLHPKIKAFVSFRSTIAQEVTDGTAS